MNECKEMNEDVEELPKNVVEERKTKKRQKTFR